MAKRLTVADILRRAKAVLEEKGWVQGKYHDYKTGAYCAAGALLHVARTPAQERAADLARELLDKVADRRMRTADCGIVVYNDAKTRTKEQVLSAFDDAIARAEKAGV